MRFRVPALALCPHTYRTSGAPRTSLDMTKQRLARDDTNGVACDETVVNSRTTCRFTRFAFARARVDYSALSPRLRGQFLPGYTPNPGTAFCVGYSDDLMRDGSSPFTGQPEPGFRRTAARSSSRCPTPSAAASAGRK